MMESFYKTRDCPSSQRLAAIVNLANDGEVREHLSQCEFCDAELEFYRRYPPREEMIEPTSIPLPLLELADALLHRPRGLSELYKLAGRGD
jgi:hypothetical protein